MSKQRNLIALDWLMPVLTDVLGQLNQLLKRQDTPSDWQSIGQHLHQITGALALVNQPLLAKLGKTLDKTTIAINQHTLSSQYLSQINQAVVLLQFEIEQIQANQQIHTDWVYDRIAYFEQLLGLSPQDQPAQPADNGLLFLAQLPTPEIQHQWDSTKTNEFIKLWRYASLQLLQGPTNQSHHLDTLTTIAAYLAHSPFNPAWRQFWQLVVVWCNNLRINEQPVPSAYASLLDSISVLLTSDFTTSPSSSVARLAVDVLLQINALRHKSAESKALLAKLDIYSHTESSNLFSQVLEKLETIIYHVHEPLTILPMLEATKTSLVNRGWVFYDNQLTQIINDVRLMTQDSTMAASLGWQVERQLQELYSQLMSTAQTLDSEIGLNPASSAKPTQHDVVRQTRVHLDHIKSSFHQYIQTHDLNSLSVNDELVAVTHVMDALALSRAKELGEQIRLLFSRIHKHSVQVLSGEASDAIADMIVRFELFIDDLSNQSVSDALLDQTQTQLNRANLLFNRLIETPITADDVAKPQKLVASDTVIYDDDGEHIAMASQQLSPQVTNAAPNDQALDALSMARQALKPDDYSMDDDIRDIFIEEAQEVLDDLATQVAVWEVDVHELVALQDIRRHFHTLKGSGRMVGANQIGEMCWAVENMLNRVLDGTLPVSDDVVEFIKQTYRKLPTLIEDFRQLRQPSIDPAITVLQATNLLHQQPINTGLSQAADIAKASVDNTQTTRQIAQITAVTNGSALPDVVANEYAQLKVVTDTIIDKDIQAIYIEEAREVIETLVPLNALWQAKPEDFDALQDIRRGFHTLKGSGRMVGANQLGELAWSIENMLNRVLDHTIALDSGILQLVNDVIGAFDELITLFANNRTDYPDTVKFWQAVANAYAKKHGAIFSYPQALSALMGEASESVSVPPANTASVAAVLPAQAKVSTVPPQATEQDSDISDDVFIEEADELLANIDTFITRHLGEPSTHVPDEILRAFRTLRGGAALIDLQHVYQLSAAVEKALGDLLHNEISLTAAQLLALQEAKDVLQTYIDDHRVHGTNATADDNTAMVEAIIARLTDDKAQPADTSKLTVKELIALDIEALLDADQQAPAIFEGDDEQVIAYVEQLAQQASRLAEATQGLSYFIIPNTLQFAYKKIADYPQFAKNEAIVDGLMALHNQLINMFDAIAAGLRISINEDAIENLRKLLAKSQYQAEMDTIQYQPVATDDELLQIFLDEVQTIQPEVQNLYNQWLNNLANLEIAKDLSNYMQTLKGGAELIGVSSIAEIALRGQQLYTAIAQGLLPSDADTAALLQKLHEIIASQLNQVKKFNRAFLATDFSHQVDDVLTGKVSIKELILAIPLIVESNPEELIEQNPANQEADTTHATNEPLYLEEIINNFEKRRLDTWKGQEPDQDVLNIYLEEAKELIESSSHHLQEFRSNTSDLSALQALQRELHTIKGGARMVGAEGIATLAHEMETIYEELGLHRKPATRMIGNLLAACHDWLASAIYVLENRFNPQTPMALIVALQQFSQKPDSLKEIPYASLATQIEQIDIYLPLP